MAGTTWTPDCMSAAEYRNWQDANMRIGQPNMRASSPCRDCPLSWRAEMAAAGCCNVNAQKTGRPRLEETADRRRWREASQRRRDRAKAAAA